MPVLIAVTTPVVGPIVATTGADELHVPPGVPLVSVVDDPAQNAKLPVMLVGNGATDTVAVMMHP